MREFILLRGPLSKMTRSDVRVEGETPHHPAERSTDVWFYGMTSWAGCKLSCVCVCMHYLEYPTL